MTGVLRFVGLLNAAVWLGAMVFCSTALLVAMNSRATMALLGMQYFEQVSGALTQIIFTRLFHLQILCALLAWVHLVAEWLYLGRLPRQLWVGLLTALFIGSLIGGLWLCPKLTRLQRAQYAPNQSKEQVEAVRHQFQVWDGVFQVVNVLMIGGIAVYFWRLTQAQNEPRFIKSVFH
ncbi:MAG: DUF4149 domain-containing protein [Verrucomicrobiota bacterium]